MTNIFAIQREYVELMDSIFSNDGEITPELLEKLNINEQELKHKAIQYAYAIKDVEANNQIIDQEIARLKGLKAQNDKKIDALENIISAAMHRYNFTKLESETLKLSFRKSESINITDETKLSDNLFRTIIKKEPDKNAIKEALKSGAEIDGASLVTNYNLQIK